MKDTDVIRTLFEQGLDMGPEQRQQLLKQHLDDQPQLKDEILSLWDHDTSDAFDFDQLDAFMNRLPPLRDAAAHLPESEPMAGATEVRSPSESKRLAGSGQLEQVGTRIGPYTLVRELARGGMGVVYLAKQNNPVHRMVAVKVLQESKMTRDSEHRFLAEQQILATLNHRNIAKMYDGGTTSEGKPFFVMEYVEGKHLDVYCQDLSLHARIKLFIQICDAVSFAHNHLILHRDLKPQNILITASGEPKLLDFGIAKVLDPHGFAMTLEETQTHLHRMTPRYASPEQIRKKTVSVASDVYSLGVILYELLTGHSPYAHDTDSFLALEKEILDGEPEKPSNLVMRTREAASQRIKPPTANNPAQLRRALKGDLDNILLKALRKDPEERYNSVAQLVEDLRCHLSGKSVSARSQTLRYRMGKFVGRNRSLLSFAAVFVILLCSVVTLAFFKITHERDLARISNEHLQRAKQVMMVERESARQKQVTAEQVNDFMISVFNVSNPFNKDAQSITARELLERGRKKIENSLVDQPGIRAGILTTLGNVYTNLGEFEEAEPLLREALILEEKNGNKVEHAKVLSLLAGLYLGMGRLDQCESLLLQALELAEGLTDSLLLAGIRKRMGVYLVEARRLDEAEVYLDQAYRVNAEHFGVQHVEVAQIQGHLAFLYQKRGEYERAEPLLRQAIRILETQQEVNYKSLGEMLNNLAHITKTNGAHEEAEALYRQLLDLYTMHLGEKHPQVAFTRNNLAVLLQMMGRVDEAERQGLQALAIRKEALGDNHPHVGFSLHNLAFLYHAEGQYAKAMELYKRTIEVWQHAYEDDHPYFGIARNNMGLVYQGLGDLDRAEDLFLNILQSRQENLDEDHLHVAFSRNNLAALYLDRGLLDEAEALVRLALKSFDRHLPKDHWRIAVSQSILGAILTEAGGTEEGLPLLKSGYEYLACQKSPGDMYLKAARQRLRRYDTNTSHPDW